MYIFVLSPCYIYLIYTYIYTNMYIYIYIHLCIYIYTGELLAFGSVEGTILIYNVTDNYSLNAIVNQHHASITSIDFSEDSKWMQSNCAALELCFFEAETGIYMYIYLYTHIYVYVNMYIYTYMYTCLYIYMYM
jgi:hypothetical protein